MTHQQRKKRSRSRRGHNVRNVALIAGGVALGALAIAAISVVGWVISVAATTPNIDELKPIDKGQTSAVFAANGRLLGYVASNIIRQPIVQTDQPQDARSEERRGWIKVRVRRSACPRRAMTGQSPRGRFRASVGRADPKQTGETGR